MTERDERREEETPEASVHVSRWAPWVWIVPLIAIFIAGFLVVRYGFFGGGDITVRFSDARGLDRYSPVRFRGAKVGTVQKITIDENLRQVVVRISMDASMNHALKTGTRFWIVEPGISGGGLGGILSGTYVAIDPGGGDDAREYAGQEYAPVLAKPEAGVVVVLKGASAGSITGGAPVQFHGMRVGTVLGSDYDSKRGVASVHAFIIQRFADRVRQSSRFWRAGGLSVSLNGGGISMNGASLASLLGAPIEFTTPEVLPGPQVAERTEFELYDSQGEAEASIDGPQITYQTYFPGAVNGVTPGTPVTLRGIPVGRVREVRLRYLPASASLETPVTFEVDARKLEIPMTDLTTRDELRGTMNDAMAKLVRKGMRATLATSLVLPGASALSLEMTGSAGSAQLVTSVEPPIVPAGAGGNGIGAALNSLNSIAGRIQNLPIEEIAGHLRSTAQRMDALVHDPALDQSLAKLNTALTDVERVTATARENAGPIVSSLRKTAASAERTAATVEKTANTASENVGPIVESLRNAATSAESAAGRAQQLMGTAPRQNYDLGALIKELTRAAESVRALASYIEENPDALLKGRGKAK